jgi:hypothetical protein
MSKLRQFVEEVEAQEASTKLTVRITKEAAVAAKNIAKSALKGAAKGGRNSAKGRKLSEDPRLVTKRINERIRRRLAKD